MTRHVCDRAQNLNSANVPPYASLKIMNIFLLLRLKGDVNDLDVRWSHEQPRVRRTVDHSINGGPSI